MKKEVEFLQQVHQYKKGDKASFSADLADKLIRKGRVKEVKSSKKEGK